MYVAGIYDLKKDKETLAGPLAAVLGVTNYEAISRLRTPGEGPLIVSVFAVKDKADTLVEKLRSAGFNATVLHYEEIGSEMSAWVVRKFSLSEESLIVETLDNKKISLSFNNIDLILRGTGIDSSTSTETVKNRSLNLGRAVLSGGLILSKTKKNVREVTTEEREAFLNLYAGDSPTLAFRENSLVYNSFGSEIKLTRKENFACLMDEFRKLFKGAKYDERLLTRPNQIGILGPVLDPEKNLPIATALLAKVLRGKKSEI